MGLLINPYAYGGINAVNFDGSTYLSKSGGFTGGLATRTLTLSFWFNTAITSGTFLYSAYSGSTRIQVAFSDGSPDIISISGNNASGSGSFNLVAHASGNLNDGNDHHFLMSVDRNDYSKKWARIDDAAPSSASWTTEVNYLDRFDFGNTSSGVTLVGGSGLSPSANYTGDIAELYMDMNYITETEENRRKFITSDGRPVKRLPSGLLWLSGETESWPNNKGSGGGFATFGNGLTTSENLPVEL